MVHDFLSYLVKVRLEERVYGVFGCKGQQVRDNLHSHDVAAAVEAVFSNPGRGAVYNIGGGRADSCSILEAFAAVDALTGKPKRYEYQDDARGGDHICPTSPTFDDRRQNREVPLTTYQHFHVPRQFDTELLQRVLGGLATPEYARCTEAEAFGLSASSVSRRFSAGWSSAASPPTRGCWS